MSKKSLNSSSGRENAPVSTVVSLVVIGDYVIDTSFCYFMQYRYSMVSVHTIEKVGLKIRFLKKPIQFFSHRISGFTSNFPPCFDS